MRSRHSAVTFVGLANPGVSLGSFPREDRGSACVLVSGRALRGSQQRPCHPPEPCFTLAFPRTVTQIIRMMRHAVVQLSWTTVSLRSRSANVTFSSPRSLRAALPPFNMLLTIRLLCYSYADVFCEVPHEDLRTIATDDSRLLVRALFQRRLDDGFGVALGHRFLYLSTHVEPAVVIEELSGQ